jgi:hypothetical protein
MRPTTIVTALAIAGFAMGSAIAQQAPTGAQGQPQGQNQAFCLQKADGSKNCGYATMAQCDAAKKGEPTASCTRNQQTTGSGVKPSNAPSQPTTGMQPANPSGPAGSSQK